MELRNLIKETVARRGCLLIPAFAVGRTQDLIYTIRKMEDEGEIPAIPVHVDSPMGLKRRRFTAVTLKSMTSRCNN